MGRKIKTIALALSACLMATAFSACESWKEDYRQYDYETYKDQVVSIDLIDYTPENVQYRYSRWDHISKFIYEPFEWEHVTVVESLPQEQVQDFLYELSFDTVYMNKQEERTVNLTNPCGRGARITYQDGTFHTITYCESSYYDENGYEYLVETMCFTYYNQKGEVAESWFLGGEWYAFVMANYFEAKVYPLPCDVEHVEV